MNVLHTHREIVRAQASAAAPPSGASIAIVAAASGLDIAFTSPRERPSGLESEAAACLRATLERLPEALRGGLAVEVGEVRSFLRRESQDVSLFSRAYRMASCRGVVLGIQEGDGAFHSPWTGTMAAAEIDPSLPVILAPSAVLALVSYALEVTGGHVMAHGDCGVTVIDTACSPYPPQHHPFVEDGAASPDRPLIVDGRWHDREEHAGDDVDPLFFLLTRPDRALRPLAAATHFNRRNLAVSCGRTVPAPTPAVVIDSCRVRVGPRSGAVPFHAEISFAGLAVTKAVALSFDPWAALARVQGACGPAVPAVDEDPIEGNGYGEAPALATDFTLADLMRKTP